MKDTKRGGVEPATAKETPQSGHTGAIYSSEISFTMHTVEENQPENLTQYSILKPHALHDPLQEALQRLDDAYVDAVNMAIASYVHSGLITEEEARRIYEQRQVWQEAVQP